MKPGHYNSAMAHAFSHAITHDSEHNTAELIEREWLLTQGAGGFAMGTALGVNTRRYHGLLIAASQPPVARVVVLNQLFEQLELHQGDVSKRIEFGGCLFLDDGKPIIAPDSSGMLKRFDRGLEAAWSYQWGALTLTRRLVLHDGKPACSVHYDITGLSAVCESATLHIRPMVTLRDFHSLEQRDDNRFAVEVKGDAITVKRDGLSACYHAPNATAQQESNWWYGVHHQVEAYRGVDCFEDLYVPGVLSVDLGPRDDASASFTATLGETPAQPVGLPRKRGERLRPITETLQQTLGTPDKTRAGIFAQASDDFIVQRTIGDDTLSTIIAGYPWFADWGRDTFIALPGLLLCTGRQDEARHTLQVFAQSIKNGLVPNRFDDADPTLAHYNTVDGSLWFIHSALAYLESTDDAAAWNDWLAQACVKIVEAYRQGTHAMAHDGQTKVPITMDRDGLIAAGDDHSQLTWMDAATWGADGQFHVFTPRPGKCVEINGLWYSALARLGERLPDAFRTERERYAELATQVKASFGKAFWSETLGHLVDHLAPTEEGWVADPSLRPNQLIACALEYSPVDPTHRRCAVEACRERLLTPAGMRTLPKDDPAYHAHYGGNPFDRDKSYHRGIVWPWLIGPYCESVLRAGAFSDDAKQEVRDTLKPLIDRMTTSDQPGALGSLAEIHDPEHPYHPRGCPVQAWSVAEVLRVLTLI